MVMQACEQLPREFQRLLHNVAVIVEDRPGADVRDGGGPLGLYRGTPLGERGTGYSLTLPDRIIIYRLPLLAACHSQAELREEVKLTVWHEIGHFFGIPEHELPF